MPFANYCCEQAEAAGLTRVCPECAKALADMGYDLEELERDNPHNQWMKDIEA